MGLILLRVRTKSCPENSQSSSPSTPWSRSTSPRKDGTASRTSAPRPVGSPLPRLVPAPLNSTTSTVVSMLVTGIATRISLRSSMLSSRTTMESVLLTSTPLTWMSPRSPETSFMSNSFLLHSSISWINPPYLLVLAGEEDFTSIPIPAATKYRFRKGEVEEALTSTHVPDADIVVTACGEENVLGRGVPQDNANPPMVEHQVHHALSHGPGDT